MKKSFLCRRHFRILYLKRAVVKVVTVTPNCPLVPVAEVLSCVAGVGVYQEEHSQTLRHVSDAGH